MTTHDAGSTRADGPPDGLLATCAAQGDRAALAAIFDRYAPRILALCRSMLRSTADAEDCLQDVFVVAATRLAGLREPDRLRAWLFAVARHECLARIEKGAREVPVDAVPDGPGTDRDQPANRALDAELAEVVHSATAGLSPRDRLALELADRQGLPTDELAAALGMSPASAYKTLVRARTTARRSLGALLLARRRPRECTQLDLLLADWDGHLTPLVRKRIARHVEECDTCAERERRLVDPAVLLGGMPAIAVPLRLRSHILTAANHALHTRPTSKGWHDGWPPGSQSTRRVARIVSTAAVVIVALILAGMSMLHHHTSQPTATAVTTTTKNPATTTKPKQHTRPTRTTTASPPTITSASANCVATTTGRTRTPRLTWTTSHDKGVELFIDNKPFGTYAPKDTVDLPPDACTPTAAAPQTYKISTTGGTGPAATRTFTLTPSPNPTTTTTPPTTTIIIG